jgi:hypothetical protein
MKEYTGCNKCKYDSKESNEFPCVECSHNRVVDYYEPKTNADAIRNMTDEELADILFDDCTDKMGLEECRYSDDESHECKKCVLEWLQAEVKEGESGASKNEEI